MPCAMRTTAASIRFLSCSRVSELDVMPDRAAASEIALTVEDLIPNSQRQRSKFAHAFGM